MKLYEGMFLLDNQAVRTDWPRAKAAVVDTLQKSGARIVSARRWDERKLAYSIRGRRRATYLLAYFEAASDGVNSVRRAFELDERILRYLILGAEAVPEGEVEKSQAELAEGYTIPPPPPDDEPAAEPEPEPRVEAMEEGVGGEVPAGAAVADAEVS